MLITTFLVIAFNFYHLAGQYVDVASNSSQHAALRVYQTAKTSSDHRRLGETAFQLGMAHYTQKQYDLAMERFEEAKTMAEQEQDALLGAKALDKMAAIYRKREQPKQALPLQKSALQYAYTARQPKLLIDLLRNLGYTFWLLQEYDSALHYYQQRIPLCTEQENIQKLIGAHTDVATVLYRLGRFETCILHYEQAIGLCKQMENTSELANISSYLADTYTRIGAHQKAYYALLTAIPILQEAQKQEELAATYSTMGTISLQLANVEEAIQFFEQSLQIRQLINDAEGMATTLHNLGVAYYHLKNYHQARGYLFKSQKICDKKGLLKLRAYTHDNLGRVYLALQQTDSALYHYQEALRIRQEITLPPHPNLADVHTELAKTYLSLGEYKQVEQHIFESMHALGLAEEYENISVHEISEGNTPISGEEYIDLMRLKGDYLGTAPADTNAWEAGLQHYETGIRFLLNSYVYAQDLDQSKLAWLTSYRPMFESAIELAYRLYEATHHSAYLDRAFGLAEQNKASLLRQSLIESQARSFGSIPDSLLASEQKLRREIAQIETHLLKANMAKDSTRAWQLRTELTQVREQYFQWMKNMETVYPEYYQLKYDVHAATTREIQQQLSPNTLMINYFLGEKYLFSYGITNDTILCNKYELPVDWNHRLQTYYRALTDHDYFLSNSEVVQQIIAEKGYYFYQKLVSPLLEKTGKTIKKLVVVPDDALNRLPFDVLLTHPPQHLHFGTFPYLAKKLSVQYTYSSTLYFQNFPYATGATKRYAFGSFSADYSRIVPGDTARYMTLPETQQLVINAAEIMQGKVWQNTTKETFMTYAPQCKIIHFGGHAIAGNTHLADNRLVFNTNSQQDRYLYLPEIYNLDLHATELVVLSACNTGIGEIKNGEGVISIAHAFQHAGTQNLLVALNVISDASTRQLLQLFYEHLDNGYSIAESLRQAKLQYLNEFQDDPLLSHPIYWASIITFGRGEAMAGEQSWYESSILLAIVVICMFVMGGSLFWSFREKAPVKKVVRLFF